MLYMDKRGISAFVLGLCFLIIGLLASGFFFLRCFISTYSKSLVNFDALFACTSSEPTLTIIILGLIVAGIGSFVLHFANR